MVLIDFPFRRVQTRELLDRPGLPRDLLAGNLQDLERVNRWLGGNHLTFRALEPLIADLADGAECRVLDVGTGGADLAAALVAWGRRRGVRIRPCALDISSEILDVARQRHGSWADFIVADGRSLPFADASFDVVACSLVLHHLGPRDVVALLMEMARVASRGIVVNDLVRSAPGWAGAWLYSRLATRNPLTRHDAPLSAQRAYTWREIQQLLKLAGLRSSHRARLPFHRVAFAAGPRP